MPRLSLIVVMSIVVVMALGATSASPLAQQPTKGLNIAPVYEGWEQNADGSYDMIFGYFNRNWNEWIDLPTGPANNIEPGGPDQGSRHTFCHDGISSYSESGSPGISGTASSSGRSRATAKQKRHTAH
jgi:hypothetical protein